MLLEGVGIVAIVRGGSVDIVSGYAPPKRLYAAFEGGGAKGLVHIGALQELEERGFDFRGVAGTSAGAIVAALEAAGYGGKDMLDSATGRSLLAEPDPRRDGKPWAMADLFGPGGWERIESFRTVATASGRRGAHLAILATAMLVTLVASAGALHFSKFAFCDPPYECEIRRYADPILFSSICLWFFGCFAAFLSHRWMFRVLEGLAQGKMFRDQLDVLLRRKIAPQNGSAVSMGDFGSALGRPSLKIVASGLTTRSRGRSAIARFSMVASCRTCRFGPSTRKGRSIPRR